MKKETQPKAEHPGKSSHQEIMEKLRLARVERMHRVTRQLREEQNKNK